MIGLIYNKTTGEVRTSITATYEEDIAIQCFEFEDYLITENVDGNTYVDIKTKTLVDIPLAPNTYSEFNFELKQWVDNIPRLSEKIISKRDILLYRSDWTDTVSAVTRLGQDKYTEWQTYRQELRDITLQAGYPLEVVFPSPPQ
jgi:hypothetical protein